MDKSLFDFFQYFGTWVVISDFNSMLRPENKKGGVPITYNDCKTFANCINNCCLVELNAVGSQFTWERRGVFERIDWGLCNIFWMQV